MQERTRRVLAGTLLAAQAVGAGYIALLCWLFSRTWIDEESAGRTTTLGWWGLAGRRLGVGAALGAAAGALAMLLCLALRRADLLPRRLRPRGVALATFLLIGLAAAAGALEFALRRPWR